MMMAMGVRRCSSFPNNQFDSRPSTRLDPTQARPYKSLHTKPHADLHAATTRHIHAILYPLLPLLLFATGHFATAYVPLTSPIRPYPKHSTVTMSSSSLVIDDIYAQMDQDGRSIEAIPMSTFLVTTVVGIPLCVAVAPLSILYQAGKLLMATFRAQAPRKAIDSGIEVNANDIIPREKRSYDVVLLGATGFTGKLGARYLAKTYGVGKEVKWAIAGRSAAKLEEVKSDLAKELGSDNILTLDTLIVDTEKPETLPSLVQDCRAVITTAGPFEQYGSPVVEFCAKYGTHYADITGETTWVRTMMYNWEGTAQRTGAKIVPLCGHDSVPWDLTVMKLEEELPQGEEIVQVECFDEMIGKASGGTIATALGAIHGRAAAAPEHEYDLFLRLPDGSKSSTSISKVLPFTVSKANPVLSRFRNMYSSFFPLSGPNSDVVFRSAALRQTSKHFVYKETAIVPDLKTGFMNLFGLTAVGIGLLNPITGYLLQKYMLPKPGEGPDLEDMEKRHFLGVTGYGIGSKGTQVQSVMYFPRDVGYLDTARMLVESGLALAKDDAKLPSSKDGGFFTPSTAMGQALLDRICRTGTYFATQTIH